MQGRLLPRYQRRYQAHPLGYWQEEFPIAKSLGLDCIEFILDYNDAERNPLLQMGGMDAIHKIAEETGVRVQTVCADYFMEAPLHSTNEAVILRSQGVLMRLLETVRPLGVTDIVIPCVDQSSLKDGASQRKFVNNMLPFVEHAEKLDINLALETDLPPEPFAELLDQFDSRCVSVNYDIGNSAALGFNPVEELKCYGERITDIHIKDRVLGDGSVMLGDGDSDFNLFFSTLMEYHFNGPFVMQTYRDDEGIEVFRKQLQFILKYIRRGI
ncbi:MAG TPA: sugar phosphate isomerase/epimerase [Gammaproteobacteria bacterium]|nr:sugar phosphate isomerase/epimerase [Gammaproteobacteria bacterium]